MEVLLNNMSSHLHAVYDVTVVFGDKDGSCLDKSKPMPGLLGKCSIHSSDVVVLYVYYCHILPFNLWFTELCISFVAYLTKPRTLHIHLQRCPVVDVPQDHDALRSWLSSRYALKDK